ncbi:hypothetical protein DE146DRAFT_644520 [Phaeosphaeria sp. MPI-PUGE-AT-0046c]|nr:hypothetical protein DE146DRAFT_644520 [Phaeosphaeria sp. MPI-PUGE-AT-0046c]
MCSALHLLFLPYLGGFWIVAASRALVLIMGSIMASNASLFIRCVFLGYAMQLK